MDLVGDQEMTETIRFVRMFDRFFDCLNVSSLSEGRNTHVHGKQICIHIELQMITGSVQVPCFFPVYMYIHVQIPFMGFITKHQLILQVITLNGRHLSLIEQIWVIFFGWFFYCLFINNCNCNLSD